MLLPEIKTALGIAQLNLNTALDAKNQPTDWMRHWDNDNRVAVSIHKDTVTAIKADSTCNLGLQKETRTGSKGDYIAYRIVKYNESEAVL